MDDDDDNDDSGIFRAIRDSGNPSAHTEIRDELHLDLTGVLHQIHRLIH